MEEVCGKSIPQKEAGGKGLSASKVRSPTVLSVGGLTFLDSPPGGAGGLTPPYPTQGSLERGKRVSCPGQDEIRCGRSGKPERRRGAGRRNARPPGSRPTNPREGSIYGQKPNTFAHSSLNSPCTPNRLILYEP